VEPEPLSAVLAGGAADAPALVSADDGVTVSYAELGERVDALAGVRSRTARS